MNMVFPYRARALRKGFSAKAAYTYVSPATELLILMSVTRILNPLDKMSRALNELSASDKSARNDGPTTLYVPLDVSNIYQPEFALTLPVAFLIMTHLGLNPVNTNGPSEDALELYEPNAE
jgi:hypothetical protein